MEKIDYNNQRVTETQTKIMNVIEKDYPEITDYQYNTLHGQLRWKIRNLLAELDREVDNTLQ